jgi:hypothetical protein
MRKTGLATLFFVGLLLSPAFLSAQEKKPSHLAISYPSIVHQRRASGFMDRQRVEYLSR